MQRARSHATRGQCERAARAVSVSTRSRATRACARATCPFGRAACGRSGTARTNACASEAA
eukprot:6464873-Lingulodinium_polyedra.AAC.1